MSRITSEDLMDETYFLLERNAAYANLGRNDGTRYFLTPEAIQYLSWFTISFVVPILTGAAGNILSNWFGRTNQQKSDECLEDLTSEREKLRMQLREIQQQKLEIEQLRKQVEESIVSLRKDQPPSPEKTHAAIAVLEEVLWVNGWRDIHASDDAKKVVLRIQNVIWSKEN
jgi:hypothetical protein